MSEIKTIEKLFEELLNSQIQKSQIQTSQDNQPDQNLHVNEDNTETPEIIASLKELNDSLKELKAYFFRNKFDFYIPEFKTIISESNIDYAAIMKQELLADIKKLIDGVEDADYKSKIQEINSNPRTHKEIKAKVDAYEKFLDIDVLKKIETKFKAKSFKFNIPSYKEWEGLKSNLLDVISSVNSI